MPKKSRKLELETIKDIVKLLTKKKKSKRKAKTKTKTTVQNTYQTPNQQYLDSLGPKIFGSANPMANLFKNPFQQPIITPPAAAQPAPKPTDWDELFNKLVEAQTKAYNKTPTGATPTPAAPPPVATPTPKTTPTPRATPGFSSSSSRFKPFDYSLGYPSSSSSSGYSSTFSVASSSKTPMGKILDKMNQAFSIQESDDDEPLQELYQYEKETAASQAAQQMASSSASSSSSLEDVVKAKQSDAIKDVSAQLAAHPAPSSDASSMESIAEQKQKEQVQAALPKISDKKDEKKDEAQPKKVVILNDKQSEEDDEPINTNIVWDGVEIYVTPTGGLKYKTKQPGSNNTAYLSTYAKNKEQKANLPKLYEALTQKNIKFEPIKTKKL